MTYKMSLKERIKLFRTMRSIFGFWHSLKTVFGKFHTWDEFKEKYK